MKKILSLLLAAALPLSAACTMVARAEENPAPSGLVPGLVEMTVFGNHVDKPESVYPQANGQIFNEGYTPENAPVYCNPIVFNYNYSANAGETLGVVSDAPFSAAEGVQPVRKRPEGREHRLEGPCLNVHYFHNHCNFRFDICFILFSDPDSVPQFSESRRNVLNFKTG